MLPFLLQLQGLQEFLSPACFIGFTHQSPIHCCTNKGFNSPGFVWWVTIVTLWCRIVKKAGLDPGRCLVSPLLKAQPPIYFVPAWWASNPILKTSSDRSSTPSTWVTYSISSLAVTDASRAKQRWRITTGFPVYASHSEICLCATAWPCQRMSECWTT